MTSPHFITELKKQLPQESWTWVIVALRQEPLVWDSLLATDLGSRALAQFSSRPGNWTPAALALLALEETISTESLRALPFQAIPESLHSKATKAYEAWPGSPDGASLPLSKAGLLALSLRERRRVQGTWQGLAVEFETGYTSLPGVLACLYGMVPDPFELLRALLIPGEGSPKVTLALHALLSNPLPEEKQADILNVLLDELPLNLRLEALRYLAAQRPRTVGPLAQGLLNGNISHDSLPPEAQGAQAAGYDFLSSLAHLMQKAEARRLCDQPSQEIPILAESLKVARRLQAQLAARLGQAASRNDDAKTAVEAWKQATQLGAHASIYSAGFTLALLDAGRPEEAQSYLAARQSEDSQTSHASLLLAEARLADRLEDPDRARQSAQKALELAGSQSLQAFGAPPATPALLEDFYRPLSQLLLELDLPAEAAQAAKLGLEQSPSDMRLSELLAQSLLASNDPAAALPPAYLVSAQQPDQAALRRLLLVSLEAAGEWQAALEERAALLTTVEFPAAGEYYELANCALHAGQPEQAAQACQQLLQIDPSDGLAYALLGEAGLALGKTQAALENLERATQLSPHQPAPWLSLAKAYQIMGKESQAQEVLQEASLVAPKSAEIQLALGEACLANHAPTQALAPLRRAASLVSTSIPQTKSRAKTNLQKLQENAISHQVALNLGKTLYQLGHLDESLQVLQAAYTTKSSPQPELAYNYAKTLLALGQTQAALAPLQIAVQAQPDKPDAYFDYARTLLQSGEHPEEEALQSIPLLRRVLHMDPTHAEAQALLAEALEVNGDLLNAMDAYRLALETHISQDSDWRARLSLGLGRVALALGQLETSIAALQEAAQAAPHSSEVHRSLCTAYLALGLANDAFLAARTALRLNPSDLETLTWFADQARLVHEQPGGAQLQVQMEAIQALNRAVQLAPARTDLLIRLGEMQLQHGDRSAALLTFSKFASNDGDLKLATRSELFQAARHLRQLGDPARAVSLLVQAVQRTQPESSADGHSVALQPAVLLAELAAAHRQNGSIPLAIQALDEALNFQPADAGLSLLKSDLLTELKQPVEALACVENALSHSPADANLNQRAALILYEIGNLPAALTHAEQAIIASNELDLAGLNLAVRCLAAELARALLRTERALELLGAWWPEGGSFEVSDQHTYACLRTELALEAGDEETAVEALAVGQKLAHSHPRSLAVQARLTARNEGFQAGFKILKAALESIDDSLQDNQGNVGSSTAKISVHTLRALSAAAEDLGQWDRALALIEQVVQSNPEEPLSLFMLARNLVLRAEAQRLCQALEIVEHAPGPAALSEEARASFETGLHKAEQLANKWKIPGEELARSSSTLAGQQTTQGLIDYLRARGRAAFQPSAQNALSLKSILEAGKSGPEDVAAYIAVLGAIGEETTASKEAQAYLQHPLVSLQLALIHAGNNPRQGLRIASSGVAALPRQGYGRFNEACLLSVLLARLAHRYGGRAEDHTTALQSIQAALDIWPDEPRWHALAAEINLGSEDGLSEITAAVAHLEQAIRLEPRHAAHYVALGNIYKKKGDTLQAVHAFEQASHISPEHPEPWLALAEAQVAAGELQQAAANAERAIELSADPAASLMLRAEIDLQTDNPADALRRVQAVLRLQPDHPQALHMQARSLGAMDRHGEALEALDKGIPLAEDPLPLLVDRARLLRRSKGLEAAIEALRGLAERYPDEPSVLALLSDVLVEAGKSEAAIQTARLALQADRGRLASEEHASLHAMVGRQLRRSGQLDQAIYHLSEAIQQMPGNLEAYLELGRAHLERRQLAQALKVYQQAIRVAPQDHRPYYQAGLALKESKDYLEAETMLRRAAELAPNDVGIHRMLGALVALNLVHNRRQAPSTQETL